MPEDIPVTMAPSRSNNTQSKRHSSLSLSIAQNTNAELPPLTALFLIDFDVKAGYTIKWKRAAPDLELDGRVEYKSLPSGLHTVRDDLIYFVDGAHAGLSAFVNEPCQEVEARNARMIAVGILVPLSYGRLGRAWRHAEKLKELAAQLAKDRHQTNLLQKYWDANKASDDENGRASRTAESPAAIIPDSPTQEPTSHIRKRSASDGTAIIPQDHRLSPYHPAWSLVKLLDKFGPLIFPIHRAALLRKRILISCHAPIHEVCDFVYNISILSNIPLSVANRLPASTCTRRLRPLFAIGVHDIPFLMEDFKACKRRQDGMAEPDDDAGLGWIACTTDSILAMKDTLWDMLITMPPQHISSSHSPHAIGQSIRTWPMVEHPRGIPVKATQRDLRRFNALRAGLIRIASSAVEEALDSPCSGTSVARPSTSHSSRLVKHEQDEAVDSLIEPVTWAALAYNGYMWWASAGEQLRSEEHEESCRDAALLADLAPAPHTPMSLPCSASHELLSDSLSTLASRRTSGSAISDARIELAIIAFFHRLTTQMLSILIDLAATADETYPSPYRDEEDGVEEGEGEEEEEEEEAEEAEGEDEAAVLLDNEPLDLETSALTVHSHSLQTMGLDVWSSTDASFVQVLVEIYFGRPARVEGKGLEVCGVRVC